MACLGWIPRGLLRKKNHENENKGDLGDFSVNPEIHSTNDFRNWINEKLRNSYLGWILGLTEKSPESP